MYGELCKYVYLMFSSPEFTLLFSPFLQKKIFLVCFPSANITVYERTQTHTHTMEQKAAVVFRIRIHIELALLDLVPDPDWECESGFGHEAFFFLDSDPELLNVLF